jgi:hypothetical protein
MQIEWFVYHKNSVLGPFTTSDVTTQLTSGKFDEESFIWWKGEKDWISIIQWQSQFPAIVQKLESCYNTEWKIKTPTMTTDSMPFDSCIEHLKSVDIKSGIYISKAVNTNWENIFSNSVFLNALEMTRRKSPRVPIVATAKISKAGSKFSYLVKLNVIGEGGIGVSGLTKNFPTSVPIDIKIESANLSAPINAEGTIIYHTPDGVTGIEFNTINAEGRALIIEYVNQFSGKSVKTKDESAKKAA